MERRQRSTFIVAHRDNFLDSRHQNLVHDTLAAFKGIYRTAGIVKFYNASMSRPAGQDQVQFYKSMQPVYSKV